MAVNIKLKHSSIQDKSPVPSDASEGELLLNINENSPAAYIKDSAGNIVKLAGADSISTADPDAVKKSETASQNMVGDLTLGTDKIALDAGEGAASFAGGSIALNTTQPTFAITSQFQIANGGSANEVVATISNTGDLSLGQSLPGGANVILEGDTGNISSSGTVYSKTVDVTQPTSGYTFIGRKADNTATFFVEDTGSAEFAGDVLSGESAENGVLIRGSDPAIKMSDTLSSDSEAYVGRTGSGTSAFQSFQLTDRNGANTVNIKGDGSGTFANALQPRNVYTINTLSATLPDLVAYSAYASQADYDNTNSPSVEILSSGAATFAGQVTANQSFFSQPDDGYSGIYVYGDNTSEPQAFVVRPAGNQNISAQINFDGSAEFAGGGIQLLADGSVYVDNRIIAGSRASNSEGGFSQSYGITAYSRAAATSNTAAVFGQNFTDGGRVWAGVDATATVTSEIFTDGAAEFSSYLNATRSTSAVAEEVQCGLSVGSSNFTAVGTTLGMQAKETGSNKGCFLGGNGNAYFSGTTNAFGIMLHLEADDDSKYDVTTEEYTETETYTVEVPVLRPEGVVGTADLVDEPKTRTVTKEREVTKTREVRTYNGAVLDVKDELQSLRSRATQQDETIKLMTAALKSLGIDTASFPSPEDEEPKTRSRKKK